MLKRENIRYDTKIAEWDRPRNPPWWHLIFPSNHHGCFLSSPQSEAFFFKLYTAGYCFRICYNETQQNIQGRNSGQYETCRNDYSMQKSPFLSQWTTTRLLKIWASAETAWNTTQITQILSREHVWLKRGIYMRKRFSEISEFGIPNTGRTWICCMLIFQSRYYVYLAGSKSLKGCRGIRKQIIKPVVLILNYQCQ